MAPFGRQPSNYGPLKIDNSVFCDKIVAAPYFI